MKFGKTFEKELEEDEIPEEWIEKSIHYKPLKKSINRVVDEMERIGLSKHVAADPEHCHLYYEFERHGDTLEARLKFEGNSDDETESIRSERLKLASDHEFFDDLYHQYTELEQFNQSHEEELLTKIQLLSSMIKQLTDGNNKHKSDMYLWREIFNQYVDFKLDLKTHFNRKTFNQFVQHITELKLIKSFKHTKQNEKFFNKFCDLNLELIQFLKFEKLNAIAVKKIIKKFDKHTMLQSGKNLTKMVTFHESKLSTQSMEQIICTDIVRVIPQLDDYLCPICFAIAYKPVRLSCDHFFCLRCMIKLQRRGEKKCPMCRDTVVMDATEQNIDYQLMELMKHQFPDEVKSKKKLNDREVTEESLQALYGGGQCTIV